MTRSASEQLKQGRVHVFNFLQNMYIYIATCLFFVGIATYVVSYVAKLIPFLGGHALVLQLIGLVLSASSGYYLADNHGYQKRVAEDQIEIDRLNTEARAKEAELNKQITAATTALRKTKNDIKTKQASINFRIDSGQLRLPSTCGLQTNTGATATAGNSTNESDVERQTIKDIVALTTEGDTAIVSLNACISQYNTVRETVNKGVK
jgi:hypothetical protein